MCLLEAIENLSLPKIKDGNSDSIILFATHNKYKKVVFKITCSDNIYDNSMSNERQIYMFVKKKISPKTPHFVVGLETGQCHQDSLEHDFFQKNAKFMKQWIQLRGKAIYQSGNENNLKKQFNKQSEYKDLYEFIHFSNTTDFLKLNYVMLPFVKGKSLEHILNTNIALPVRFDIDVCIQIAQALCVAEYYKFTHHDLRMGNIYIEIFKEPIIIKYKYPFEFALKTKYKIHIFDYDLSSIEILHENSILDNDFCNRMGMCNQFLKNEDWRYFLFNFIAFLEEKRPTVLRNFIGFEDSHKNYIGTGRACIKVNDSKCTIDKKAKMKSPLEFLEFYT